MAWLGSRRDEDDVDRVNRVWTVLLLTLFGLSVLLYLAVFPDSAVTCLPVDDSKVDALLLRYANMYCLDESVFHPDYYVNIPFSYHVFIPLFMFYQAIAFISPHILAQFLKRLLGSGSEFLFIYAECKGKDLKESHRLTSPAAPSNRGAVIYLLKKFLFLVNSVVQLVFVAIYFSPDKELNGIIDKYHKGNSLTPFPRFGRCRFDVEDMSTQHYQCAFHINALLKKMYLMVFYWLVVVAFANLVSLVTWCLLLFVPSMTSQKISAYTLSANSGQKTDKMKTFIKERLGLDFLLYLQLAQSTEREATAADLTLQLWQGYDFPQTTQEEPGQNEEATAEITKV